MKYLVLLFMIATTTHAGDRVWNGGGLAEKNILMALLSLDQYIDECLRSPSCKVDQSEKEILREIKKVYLQEPQGSDFIQFKSHIRNEENFDYGEGVKIAKTKTIPGSPIFINRDLLYRRYPNKIEAFTIAEAVALLVHEIGHHTGEKDHTLLDLLGVKVSLMVEKNLEKAPFFPTNNKIQVVSFNSEDPNQFPEVLIYLDDQIINITKNLKSELDCPKRNYYLSEPNGATFHNIYWKPYKRRSDHIRFTFEGNLWLNCHHKESLIGEKPEGKYLEVSFKARIRDLTEKSIVASEQFQVYFVPGSLDIKIRKMWELVGEGNPLDAIPGN